MKSALGMTGWMGEGALKRVCYSCLANKSTLPFTDPSEHALWRQTMLTHRRFMLDCFEGGGYISKLFSLPGFQHEYIDIDLMHCCCLGVVLYLCACVIYDLIVEMNVKLTSPGPQLAHILMLIKQASKATELNLDRPPINALTMTMVKGKGAPKLKIKASEARGVLKCLKFMLEHFFEMNTYHQKLRYQCVDSLFQMYAVLNTWSGPEDGIKAASLARKCIMLYCELQEEDLRNCCYQKRGFVLYKLYPKMHQLVHCLEFCKRGGNPKEMWCYCDESEIGAATRVAESCHSKNIHRCVIKKHRVGA